MAEPTQKVLLKFQSSPVQKLMLAMLVTQPEDNLEITGHSDCTTLTNLLTQVRLVSRLLSLPWSVVSS